jgi:hypothetical protein
MDRLAQPGPAGEHNNAVCSRYTTRPGVVSTERETIRLERLALRFTPHPKRSLAE